MTTTGKAADATQFIRLDDEDAVKNLLVESVFGLWDIVNNLTRLRPSKWPFFRVSIFGSARAREGTPVYNEVKKLAAALTGMGCDIVTGGGPGLMQAANEGAVAGHVDSAQRSVGIRVRLPFEQGANKYVEQMYEHQTFFTRLHHFALASDAFVVVPGGIGTVLETLMVWQLLQVKHLQPIPLILVGAMYAELVEWARKHMTGGPLELASPKDIDIPVCARDIDEVVSLIKKRRDAWLEDQNGRSC